MSDDSLIPISDEQAKLGQEIVASGRDFGRYLGDILGDLPKDLVGLLMGDKVKAWRAKRIIKLWEDVKKRLGEQGITEPEPPNPKIALPILAAAADENREELQDLWARLLAAAMHPDRAKQVRLGFAEALQRLDPLDSLVMRWLRQHHFDGVAFGAARNKMAVGLNVTSDEVDVSLANLVRVGFAYDGRPDMMSLTPFGREFLRTVWQ